MAWLARLFRRWGVEYFVLASDRKHAAQGDVAAMQRLAQWSLEQGEIEEAQQWIEQAIARAPTQANLWVTLAAVHRQREDLPHALEALAQALQLAPDHARALTNLAEIEVITGQASKALGHLAQALAKEPKLLPAQVNRIAALVELGRHEEARAEGEALLAEHPDHPELLLNTANALLQLARGREAVKRLRRALAIRRPFPQAEYLLASLTGDAQALAPALDYLEKRLALRGETMELLTALANGHQAAGHLSRARALALRILERKPGHRAALLTLASISSTSGHADEADALYARLFDEAGDLAGLASNWLFEGNYLPQLTPAELAARHRRWAQSFGETPSQLKATQHTGPLRVGYVSGDLCRHPVGYLILAVLKHHDRQAITPIAFSTTLREDELTRELRSAFAAWHDVFDRSDDELIALIHEEKIDILVDLAGHTAFHRLTVFARRAAPVQVSWIGYFHSTGLANIDYLLTDPATSPASLSQYFSETPIYLGSTRFCFSPPPYAPEVSPAPTERGLPFTFGCFNRLAKLNDEVIAVWSEILRRTPHTRLWLKAGALKDAWVRQDLVERFRGCGIEADRLVLRPGSGHGPMLEEFAMVDLCLDPFPFTGGATSLEAFWMGVPTLTVPGATMVSRQTHAMNVNLSLEKTFSACGVRDYIERAVAFAEHPQPLWSWRTKLRPLMAQSPLCDGQGFTRRLESFYRQAHEAALTGRKLSPYHQVA